jgi:hypothetical protein
MDKIRLLLLATVGATIFAGAAVAQDAAAQGKAAPSQKEDAAVLNDVAKVSQQGALAFRAIHLARRAIYSADPTLAKEDIDEAVKALSKAQTDSAILEKAEADLKPPKGAPAPAGGEAPSTEKIKWLPFDGTMAVADDFVATPEATKAVAEANGHLAKGEKKAALEKLKLARIDLVFTTALAPLDKTIAGVNEAKTDIDQGKYYEANAALRKVEDSVRYDTTSVIATPEGKKAASPTTDESAPAATAPAKTH